MLKSLLCVRRFVGLLALALIASLPLCALAGKTSTSNDDEVWRNRPFISHRAETPPPESMPTSEPVVEQDMSATQPLQPTRTIDLPDGKKVAWVAAGEGSSHFDLLGRQLGQMADQMDWGGGVFAAYVEDARYVIPILDYQADKPLAPASAEKIATFAAALKLLSPKFTFNTALQGTGAIVHGVLKGNLIVRGSGDPSLSVRYNDPSAPIDAPFREWGKQLRRMGIHGIDGNILGDAGAFDAATSAPGWPIEIDGDWRVPEVSALSFNENLLDFHWKAERKEDVKPGYWIAPLLKNIEVYNEVKIDNRSGRDWRSFSRKGDENVFEITGGIPAHQSPVDGAAVHQPDAMFIDTLKSALATEGVPVKGLTSLLSEVDAADIATTNSHTLFVHRSAPLVQLLPVALHNDDNLHAELIFKTLGRLHGDGGTFQGGTQALEQFKSMPTMDGDGTICIDGSGLSRLDRLTPHQLVSAMKIIAGIPGGEKVLDALPVAGQPGLMQNHFNWSPEGHAALGKVRALPGFAPGNHVLVGSVVTANGREIYFALMLNGSTLSKAKANENLERLVLAMTKSPLPAEKQVGEKDTD